MEEIVEADRFDGRPSVEAEGFVLYFNLEFGLHWLEDESSKFTAEDFSPIGFFKRKSGQEAMFWSIEGRPGIYAIAVPKQGGGHILDMTDENPEALEEIDVG